jgi:RecJ-like exonuclease
MLHDILDEEVTMKELALMKGEVEAAGTVEEDPDTEAPCPECHGSGTVQVKDDIMGVCPGCWGGESDA